MRRLLVPVVACAIGLLGPIGSAGAHAHRSAVHHRAHARHRRAHAGYTLALRVQATFPPSRRDGGLPSLSCGGNAEQECPANPQTRMCALHQSSNRAKA